MATSGIKRRQAKQQAVTQVNLLSPENYIVVQVEAVDTAEDRRRTFANGKSVLPDRGRSEQHVAQGLMMEPGKPRVAVLTVNAARMGGHRGTTEDGILGPRGLGWPQSTEEVG